ncbi:MAG: Molybdopterin-synthase adenylyltransferase [Syntrophaceae bacterium PtaU1.Bin231]|nr:MAG: Molybdopterin-synthase adenylyltransferase [Syntrophaceae bacterium PtaU1.Bin231]
MAEINPGVAVTACRERLTAALSDRLFVYADVIVDGLDNVRDRLLLQDAAHRLHVPLVHGALAGFEGRIMTVYPGDPGLALLYGKAGEEAEAKKRPEALLGVPAVTAAVIGSLQAMEVLKVLLGRGEPIRNAILHVDLENGRWETFRFDGDAGGKS